MKRIAEWVFGVAGICLLTTVAINQGFRWLSAPDDLEVLGGLALLAMTVSAWVWLGIHCYHRVIQPQVTNRWRRL